MPQTLEARDHRDLALLRRYKTHGDPLVLEQLVRRLTPFVRYLTRPYFDRGEPREDLLQVGALALVQAIERFDPGHGTTFTAFASPTITGALKRHFRDTTWRVHVPRGLQELDARRRRCVSELGVELGRAATTPEVAARLGVPVRAVDECRGLATAVAPVAIDDERTAPSGVDAGFARVEDADALRQGARALSERERHVLWMRHAESLTQREIGDRLGVSQVQISRVLQRATRVAREAALFEPRPAPATA